MRHINTIFAIAILLLVSNCEKEATVKPKNYPFVITRSPAVGDEGVEFYAEITDLGRQQILKYGFVWSDKPNPGIHNSYKLFEEKPSEGVFSFKVKSGLAKGKSYYVRSYILTNQYEIFGNEKSFVSQGSLPPIIRSVSPLKGYTNTEVIIEGENFGTNINDITVRFGNVAAEIDSISDTYLKVRSPLITDNLEHTISIEVADMTVSSNDKFNAFYSWKYIGDYPEQGNYSASYFSVNGKGYMIGGAVNLWQVWEFDPSDYSWTKKESSASANKAWVVDNTGYIYSDFFNSVYKYDATHDTWELETTYPGHCRGFSCFVIDDEVYMGAGVNRNNNNTECNVFFKYNINTREWSQIASFPGLPRHETLSFSLNGKGYIALGKKNYANWSSNRDFDLYSEVWEYDKTSDRWTQKNDFPGSKRVEALSFVLGSKAYVGMGVSDENYGGFPDFWEYNQVTDSWTEIDHYIGNGKWSNVAFTIQDKAYVGLGTKHRLIGNGFKDLWEFDPHKQ